MAIRAAPAVGRAEAGGGDGPGPERPGDPTAERHDAADQLLGAMALVRRTVRRLSGRPELLAGLTSSQGELVGLLRRAPGLSVAEAAERLGLAPNTVSTLVGQLCEAGIVVRAPDPGDRRVTRLDLGADARRKVSQWRDRRAEALSAAMTTLPPQERQLLTQVTPLLVQLAGAVGQEATRP